ncbi:RNA-splicing factor [Mortierella alpina]|nr:RNA-splicing factor [Mortierella alpina]
MGGGDLNLKKSWHPGTFRNQEKVWKEERKAADEEKKLQQLRKELEEERQIQELQRIQEQAGGKKRSDRLDWMYQAAPSAGARDEKDLEDYLLGKRRVDDILNKDSGMKALSKDSNSFMSQPSKANSLKDIQSKIREDPLLAIKRREQASMEALMKNPIKMRQLKEAKDPKKKKSKKSKEDKADKEERRRAKSEHRSKRRSSRDRSDDSDSDDSDDRHRRSSRKQQRRSHSQDRSRSPHKDSRPEEPSHRNVPITAQRSPDRHYSSRNNGRQQRSRSRSKDRQLPQQNGSSYVRSRPRSPPPSYRRRSRSRSPAQRHSSSSGRRYRSRSRSPQTRRRPHSRSPSPYRSSGRTRSPTYDRHRARRASPPLQINGGEARGERSIDLQEEAKRKAEVAEERARKLKAMTDDASAEEQARKARLAEIAELEAKQDAEDEAKRMDNSKGGQASFMKSAQKSAYSGMSMADRVQRGRATLQSL